jgi:type IV pilus assembly protein PilB
MTELRVLVRSRSGLETSTTCVVEVIALSGPSSDVASPDAAATRAAPESRKIVSISRRVRLGHILVEAGVLTQADLKRALEEQQRTGERLGVVLRDLGLGSQEAIAAAVAQQLDIEYVRMHEVAPDASALLLVPEPLARRHQLIPLRTDDRTLVVGMVDPLDILAVDDVRRLTGREVVAAVITLDDFHRAIAQYPNAETTADALIGEIAPIEAFLAKVEESTDTLLAVAKEAPVIRLVNLIMLEAVRKKVSDIHIEPQETQTRIRFRIDGALYPAMTPPSHVHPALVSRVKIISNLDIAERRLPQDGRIDLKVDGRDVSMRVSTIPTMLGEKVVMRILDKSNAVVALDRLGLAPDDAQRIEQLINRPYGILLVTGPTGSGKTTSLYAMLNRLNRPEVNIMTIEDPVEYQLSGINQVAINARAGLTFATGLRSFLRQDPDIIMVGEIRDEETARIAIQASLTGHFVLSTLHTNDAPSSVERLMDMGVEPFLVASSITGVVAQRLVRVLCERCREPYEPSLDLLGRLGLPEDGGPYTFHKKVGCAACNQTGYRGRIGIYEILSMDSDLRQLIVHRAGSAEIRQAAAASGMKTLRENGLAKVLAGVTTADELFRTVYIDEDRRRRLRLTEPVDQLHAMVNASAVDAADPGAAIDVSLPS